jgi:hypothetical protein
MSTEPCHQHPRDQRLKRALVWLLDSGIQQAPGTSDAGGVWAWIDEDTRKPSYLYSEITGYFLSLCVQIHRQLADLDPGSETERRARWLGRAEAAAAWLLDCAQDKSGAILSRKYLDAQAEARDPWSFAGGRVAFFDCAMVGFGLVQLARATGEPRWLEGAERIGAYLLAQHETADHGHRFAAFDVHAGVPVAEGTRWSQHFGPFELKSALFLDSLADATQDTKYRGLLERILEYAVASQHPSGRFPTHPRGESTHLHPHCYTIEGLLYLVVARGRSELLPRVERALDWMFSTCLVGDTPLEQWSERSETVIPGTRSDALAQALRAYEIVKGLNPLSSWSWEGELGVLDQRLCRYAMDNGGTRYGADETGAKPSHLNAWAHFFRTDMEVFARLRRNGRTLAGTEFLLV